MSFISVFNAQTTLFVNTIMLTVIMKLNTVSAKGSH